MSDNIIDNLNENSKSGYPLGRMWCIGIGLGFGNAILLSVISFVFLFDELDLFSQVYYTLVNLFFSAFALKVIFRTYNEIVLLKSIFWKKAFKIFILISFTFFILKNLLPRRVGPEFETTIFDKAWYFAPQTAFGYPWPYLRYLDEPLKSLPDPIVDVGTGAGNIFLYCLFLYCLAGVVIFVHFLRKIKYAKRTE